MTKTKIKKLLIYFISIAIIFYILYSIGVLNIYTAIISTNVYIVFVALLITILAAIIRIYKFKILLYNKEWNSVIEIFLASRLGKEVTFAGYFIPLIKKDNRGDGTFQNLIVDRYTEILSTLIIALISCFFVLKNTYYETIIFIFIAAFSAILILIPFIKIPKAKVNNKLLEKLISTTYELRDKLILNSQYIFKIYFLSCIATLLDFITVIAIFLALKIHINFFIVSIIWASSGLISTVAFIIVGLTELSSIYLYKLLAGVNNAITASFIVVYRLLTIVSLGTLFLLYILFFKNKQLFVSLTNRHV